MFTKLQIYEHGILQIIKICYFFRFFPLQQTIDVTYQPITNVNFLQLKATLTGTVNCLPETDCSQASVTLKILDGVTIKTVQARGESSKSFITLIEFSWYHIKSCNNKYGLIILFEKFDNCLILDN